MLKKSTPTLRISPCTASGLTCQLSVTLKKTFCVSSEAAATEPSPAALSLNSARCTLMSTRRRSRQGAMNCGPSPTWPTILPNSETTPTSPAGIGWYDRKSVSPMLASTNTTTTPVIAGRVKSRAGITSPKTVRTGSRNTPTRAARTTTTATPARIAIPRIQIISYLLAAPVSPELHSSPAGIHGIRTTSAGCPRRRRPPSG